MAATYELTEASRRGREEQEKLLAEFELRRKIRAAVMPTDDAKVRAMLRQLSEPVTLFGEREMERRDRLKKIVAERGDDAAAALDGAPVTGAMVVEEAAVVQKELFHTEGPPELQQARLDIARWSLKRAAARVYGAKRLAADVDALRAAAAARDAAEAAAKRAAQQSSEIADDRPVGGCAFSPDGALLAACGWGGQVNLWRATDSANVKRLHGFRAHAERATGIAWHPHAAPGAHSFADPQQQQQQQQEGTAPGTGTACLLTGCADGTAALFSLTGARLAELRGHTDRLGRVAWHPMGRHVATPSYDLTWRLWDVETGACLLEQEGHSRAVYAAAFHPDGALAASVGLDAVGRVWDCRTGRTAHVLEGHVKGVLSVDFSPDGYTVATGGDDHAVRVWDLRKRACAYVIPAHRSLVSAVRWHPSSGHVLLTAGYDAAVKLWSTRDWSLLKALAGHEGKVMAADIAPAAVAAGAGAASNQHDGGGGDVTMDDAAAAEQQQQLDLLIGSAGYDRTVKLWSPQDVLGVLGGGGGGGGDDLPF